MLTDLTEIRRLAGEKEAENLEFRRFVEAHHPRAHLFVEIARGVEKQVDCTACASCCRNTRVDASGTELETIADSLSMTAERVTALYTELDPRDHRRVLRQEDGECVFLSGNRCLIYDARPRACRDFPHINHEETRLGGRMSSVCRNAWLCPIVYNALEELKRVTGFHPHGR